MTTQQKARYRRMIRKGVSPKLAECLALQQPPGTKDSDRAFMEGRLHNQGVTTKSEAELVLGPARAAGVDTAGKVYISSLSDERGPADPSAWVDSIGDLKKRTQAKIGRKQREADKPDVPLSENCIKEGIQSLVREDSSLKRKKKAELREMALDKFTPHWKKKR